MAESLDVVLLKTCVTNAVRTYFSGGWEAYWLDVCWRPSWPGLAKHWLKTTVMAQWRECELCTSL